MRIIICLLFTALVSLAVAAPESETLVERTLRRLLERQLELFADAQRQGDKLDISAFQTQVQALALDYEAFLRSNPTSATGFAAYGRLLGRVGMDGQALGVMLKAAELNPNDPMVKNQIGNHLAEGGKPLEALAFFLAAVQLAPEEPLYHYQLGTLLTEARDDFLKSGEWTREALDRDMLAAFGRAAELAPDRIEFTYRHAEAYYDLEQPDWDVALKAWAALEEKAENAVERETMRLHAANILIKQGKPDHARLALTLVTEAALQGQKEKLIAELDAANNK
jgi:tetratricopeptide (TPR) repeat protein